MPGANTLAYPRPAVRDEGETFYAAVYRTTTTSKTLNDFGFEETDRIDVPNLLLPGAVTSSDPLTNKVSVAVPSVSGPGSNPQC